jgi:hypothetical protein
MPGRVLHIVRENFEPLPDLCGLKRFKATYAAMWADAASFDKYVC